MLTGLNLGLVNEGRKPSWRDKHPHTQKNRDFLHSKEKKEEKKKSFMKKAIQSDEERGERKKRTHLFILQKLREMAGNLTKSPRSLPIIGMTHLRRGRSHENHSRSEKP